MIKRIAKFVLKRAWRMTGPMRRPLMRRFDARVSTLVSNTVNSRILPELIPPLGLALERLERIEQSLSRADRATSAMTEEIDLVLNGVSREIFRLQVQVETLQRIVNQEIRHAGLGLSLVAETGEEEEIRRPSGSAERSMVG